MGLPRVKVAKLLLLDTMRAPAEPEGAMTKEVRPVLLLTVKEPPLKAVDEPKVHWNVPALFSRSRAPPMVVKGAVKVVRTVFWMETPPLETRVLPVLVNARRANWTLLVTERLLIVPTVSRVAFVKAALLARVMAPMEVALRPKTASPGLLMTLISPGWLMEKLATRLAPVLPLNSIPPPPLLLFEVLPMLMLVREVPLMENPLEEVRAGMLREGEVMFMTLTA